MRRAYSRSGGVKILLVLSVLSLFAGCAEVEVGETTSMGAATGGVLGAGLGAIVGNQTGSTGGGMVIGALAGASTGAAIGNMLEGQEKALRSQDEAIERQESLIRAQSAEIKALRDLGADANPSDFRRSAGRDRFSNSERAKFPTKEEIARLPVTPFTLGDKAHEPMAQYVPQRVESGSRKVLRERSLSDGQAESHEVASTSEVLEQLDEEAAPRMKKVDSDQLGSDQLDGDQLNTAQRAEAVGRAAVLPRFDAPSVNRELGSQDLATQVRARMQAPSGERTPECKTAADEFQQSQRAYDSSQKLFHLRRALRLCPEDASYHNALGELYLKLNRSEDARFEFGEALKIDPGYRAARENISRLKERDTNGLNMRNRLLLPVVAFVACVALSACEGQRFGAREKGALGGAALGAGLGAIIGNQVGNAGAGVAIGSGFGALAGGLIGNEIDNTDQALSDRERRIADQDRELQENRRLLQELRSRGADVRISDRGVVVNLPDVLFAFDSARLTGAAIDTVREIAEVARTAEGRRIAVEGHTDSVGTIAYNRRLSEDRARAVAGELTAEGVGRGRLSVRGFGESEPIASNATESGRARNRRVEVIIENN